MRALSSDMTEPNDIGMITTGHFNSTRAEFEQEMPAEINDTATMSLRVIDPDIFKIYTRITEITKILVPTMIIIILILGLIGNVLVVYITVITNRTTKHPIHSLFVLNLATADILFLLFCAPYYIVININSGYSFGPFLCRLLPFLSTCTMAASIYTICALAWMRFMALVMPFRFRRSRISTRKAGYFVIFAIWTAGLLLSLPTFVYTRLQTDPDFENVTLCQWHGEGTQTVFVIVKLIATYFLPLLLITIFYAVIFREVFCFMMKHGSNSNGRPGSRNRTEEQKDCAKSTMVVLSLILAFLICWSPHMLQTMFQLTNFKMDTSVSSTIFRYILETVGVCMGYAYACINPYIYTFASPIFRRSLHSSLREKLGMCGAKPFACGGAGLPPCSIRRRRKQRRDVMELKTRRNSEEPSASQGKMQPTALLISSGTVGHTVKTDQLALTAAEHHTTHTTVGSPQTSPVHSDQAWNRSAPHPPEGGVAEF